MARDIIIFIFLMGLLAFIMGGCDSTESEPVEFQETDSAEIEPTPVVSFHNKCANILNNFVDDRGMVDYRAIKQRRSELKEVLDAFDDLDPNEYNSWPKEDKIAFWLNAYNMQLLNVIVRNYPIQSSRIHRLFWPTNSIRHIKGIWNEYKFIVMDEEFTLKEIEEQFFRGEFDEPQVFFAVSYASLSGSPLRNEPYYGYKLYEQLEEQAKKFLSNSSAFDIDRQKKRVYLSAIFQSSWYGREFIGKYGTDKKFKDKQPVVRAVLNYITKYLSEQDVSFLETENYSTKYIIYNWTLNE